MPITSRILRLGANTRGRDFVIGDVHGAFDLVLESMRQVTFDKDRDRLFSVGDLVDRGPESHRCLRFLRQPYVYAVRGNHEQMLIDIHAGGEPPEALVQYLKARNGFGWWEKTEPAMRAQIVQAVSELPLAIEVQTPRGTVGLLHAEVPIGMSWPKFLHNLEAGDEATIESCLEGRQRVQQHDSSGVHGVGRIFVGHSIHWQGATRYGNVYAIDSGAIFGQLSTEGRGFLTMSHLAVTTAAVLAPRNGPQLVDILGALSDDIPESKFGEYTAQRTHP